MLKRKNISLSNSCIPNPFQHKSREVLACIPSPLQSEHTDCICCTIPGASCLIIITHTYPLHALQSTFLLSCSLVVLPLYRSSKDTLGRKELDSIKFCQVLLNTRYT
uniref:Uncharacterized protein n=2 Tax=Felidae TaxID=9681 RepID=A0ABI7W5Z6_FELCA